MGKFYQTLQSVSKGLYKERGSKFFAYAKPVIDTESAQSFLQQIKSEHPKARHHCFAYRLGTDGLAFRSFDDGEPSGTAGKPILGQIDSYGLTNTLIVVVRYFGGKLLGASGLIKAYRESANEAIINGNIISREIRVAWEVYFDFSVMGTLFHTISHLPIKITTKDIGVKPYIIIETPAEGYDYILDTMIAGALQLHQEQINGRRSFDQLNVIEIV